MARPLRVNIADGWYHVMHRGIERRTIFDDRREKGYFLELLGEVHDCGLTLSELGQQTGGSDYAAVSMGLRRFEKRMKGDRKLRSEYDQAKQMLNIQT